MSEPIYDTPAEPGWYWTRHPNQWLIAVVTKNHLGDLVVSGPMNSPLESWPYAWGPRVPAPSESYDLSRAHDLRDAARAQADRWKAERDAAVRERNAMAVELAAALDKLHALLPNG